MGNLRWIFFVLIFAGSIAFAKTENANRTNPVNLEVILEEEVIPFTEQLKNLNRKLQLSNSSQIELNDDFLQVTKDFGNINGEIEELMYTVGGLLRFGLNQVPVVPLGFLGDPIGKVLTEMITRLFESYSHWLSDAASLSAYDSAIRQYREVHRAVRSAEEKMDGYLGLSQLIRSEGSQKNLTEKLNLLIFHQEIQLEILKKIAEEKRINLEKVDSQDTDLLKKVDQLGVQTDTLIRSSKGLRTILDSTREEIICENLKDGIRVIYEAEKHLQGIRLNLLDLYSRGLWFRAFQEAHQSELKNNFEIDFEKHLKDRAKIENREYLDRIRADSSLYTAVKKSLNRCIADKRKESPIPIFIGRNALFGVKKLYDVQVEECWKEVVNPFSHYANPYLEEISELFKQRENQVIETIEAYQDVQGVTIAPVDLGLYRGIVGFYDRFFVELTQQQAVQSVQKRMKTLSDKRTQIDKACRDVRSIH
jgi:hypothetical protein